MIRRIIRFSATNRVLVILATAVVVGYGIYTVQNIAVDAIPDLSHLWVLADVYEADLPSVRVGAPAVVGLAYLPGRAWKGAVTWIAPTVDPQTRTIKVRVEVDNQGEELKPEMFADVELRVGHGRGLGVPDSAVLHSGQRQLVFVDLGDGQFEPREVTIGARTDQGVQVLGGLREGECVVTAANFRLDSESSLKAALQTMSPAPGAPAAGAPPAADPHAGHRR